MLVDLQNMLVSFWGIFIIFAAYLLIKLSNMKRILIVFAWVLTAIVAFADDMDQFVPANWGNWKNLSVSVNDLTYYDNNPLPMQAAVSGKTIHVAWPDWKANADGYYCLLSPQSTSQA